MINAKYALWNYESQFDNSSILNSLNRTTFLQPLIQYTEITCLKSQQKINYMELFKGGNNFKKTLRLLSTQVYNKKEKESRNNQKIYFCIPQKNQMTNLKKFSILSYEPQTQYKLKTILRLDQPTKVLVLKHYLLVSVQQKSISLYHIQNQQLILKDFDNIGIGNRLILTDLYHHRYKNRDYLLIFGNQKEQNNSFFKCLVYQISQEKLHFIKKATLCQGQTYKPIVLFDNYSSSQFNDQQYCLVVGGYSDYQQKNYIFGALQIHLHLLLEQWITYPIKLTHFIQFSEKHTITAGKAIKISNDIVNDQCWLLFCTQYQTLTKLYVQYGHTSSDQFKINKINLFTKTFQVKTQTKGQIESIFYSENTIYLLKDEPTILPNKEVIGEIPYKLTWCDKKLQNIRSRPLDEILKLFANK